MMNMSDAVATYFIRVSHLKDQLKAIRYFIDDAKVVTVDLNGFPPSWDPFVQGICVRPELPKFERLWIDCVQEEARILSKQSLQRSQDDRTQALTTHARKGKRNFSRKDFRSKDTIIKPTLAQE